MGELLLMNLFLGAASKELPTIRLFRANVLNVEIKQGLRVKAGLV